MYLLFGYMLGKMIGNLIVSFMTLVFRVLHVLLVTIGRVLMYVFKGVSWFIGKLWEEGLEWYDNYKLNLK